MLAKLRSTILRSCRAILRNQRALSTGWGFRLVFAHLMQSSDYPHCKVNFLLSFFKDFRSTVSIQAFRTNSVTFTRAGFPWFLQEHVVLLSGNVQGSSIFQPRSSISAGICVSNRPIIAGRSRGPDNAYIGALTAKRYRNLSSLTTANIALSVPGQAIRYLKSCARTVYIIRII